MRAIVAPVTFPITVRPSATNYDTMASLYTDALDGFLYDFKLQILHKLIPGLTKIGFEPGMTTSTSTTAAPPRAGGSRLPPPPSQPQQPPSPYGPPSFEDPLRMIPPRYDVPWPPPNRLEPYAPDDPSRMDRFFSGGSFIHLNSSSHHLETPSLSVTWTWTPWD